MAKGLGGRGRGLGMKSATSPEAVALEILEIPEDPVRQGFQECGGSGILTFCASEFTCEQRMRCETVYALG